jgi:hypothetical protein
LWQDGINASDFLYSDTAFAALPNGTTLYAGQILAPPAYWSGVNGLRYALDDVYQTGTTGTPNGGSTTTCTNTTGATVTSFSINGGSNTLTVNTTAYSWAAGQIVVLDDMVAGYYLNGVPLILLSSGLSSTTFEATFTHGTDSGTETSATVNYAQVFACSSANDLSPGQRITVGTDTDLQIKSIDATNPSLVNVYLASNARGSYTNQTLSFSPPLLGPEMQMPTKSSSAPASLTWSQGDMEQNSGATANGIAGWVNVSAGTPGTWAGIPLGNSSGVLAGTQVAAATSSSLGVVQPDNTTISVNGGGVLSTTCDVGSGLVEKANAGNGVAVSPEYAFPPGTLRYVVSSTVSNVNASSSAPYLANSLGTTGSSWRAGFTGNIDQYASRLPTLSWGALFPQANDLTNSRIWMGQLFVAGGSCTSPISMTGTDTPFVSPPGCGGAAIRYSTGASDTSFQCVSGNGTNEQIQSIGVTPASGTFYQMSISHTSTSVTCTVNGTSVTNSTYYPQTTDAFLDVFVNTSTATTALNLSLAYVKACETGTF